ncbi:MAG: hypothetical protein H6582_00900 [Crocinitomicaceae bacterium]|nr:hypothetical protein [Crocinitomicaceae bacterium]
MERTIIIKEGITYDYLPHGLGTMIVLGAIGFIIHPVLGFFGLAIGITIMGLRAGIEIDTVHKRIRRYHAAFFLRFGKWFDLKHVVGGKLVYNSQSNVQNFTMGEGMTVFSGGMGTTLTGGRRGTAKTYDLQFEEDTNSKIELYHSFTAMKPAFETVKVLNDLLKLNIENQLLTMQGVLGKNRRR